MNDLDKTGGANSTVAAVLGLERPLEHISEAKFREVAKLLEEVREQPGVQQILDHVRPRLVKLRPARKPNLQRLFYLPLEDLLVAGTGSPDNGMLPRQLPALAWKYVVEAGDAEARKQLEGALRRVSAGDREGQMKIAERLWPWAASVLADLVSDPGRAKDLLGRNAGLLAELKEIVALLQVAREVEALRRELPPRPIRTLGDEQMGLIRRAIAEGAKGDPEIAYVMVLIVMVRMAKRADFLEGIMGMTLGLSTADKPAVYARLCRLVMTEVTDRARQLSATDRGNLVGLADNARSLVTGLVAAEKALKNDPKARQQLNEMRKTAEKTVTQVVDNAKGSVVAAISIGAAAPLESQIETENSILALRKCQTFANQIGLDKAVAGALGGIVGEVRQRADKLFAIVARKDGAAPDRKEAEQQMYWAVRMTELAGNPDDADKLRRQGLRAMA
ncbi:MAG TPA: hypothetical protein VKQ29_15640 [Aliidongia sp.]|nr:hypothetical protein [Aliidongia sp.]